MLILLEAKGRKRRRWLSGETCDDCGGKRIAAFDIYRDGEAFPVLICGSCDWYRAGGPLPPGSAGALRQYAIEGAGTAAATPG